MSFPNESQEMKIDFHQTMPTRTNHNIVNQSVVIMRQIKEYHTGCKRIYLM